MSLNNVRAVGDDRPWKDEVERELKTLLDIIKYGKISLRAAPTSTGGGGGSGGPGADAITATLPATYDNLTFVVGVDQDAFDHISSLDYAQFDTTVATGTYNDVGLLTWNDTDGTLEFGLKGGEVTLQIGQEQVLRVRNNTGSTLPDGSVVYISGSDGTNFNVTPAIATGDATSAQTLGVLTQEMNTSSTQHGYVTTFGLVRNIDLSYISGLAAGDQLYLDGTTAGRMTKTKPSAPLHMVYVGTCLSANGGGSNSTIFVKVQNGYELEELHDVKITGTVANNEVLAYTSSTSLWENKTASEAGLVSTSDVGTVTNTMLAGSIDNSKLVNSSITVAGNTVSLGGSTGVSLDNLSDVAISGPATDEVLKYNGTSWVNAASPGGGGGTVTSIAAGTGLSASPSSPITTSGTLNLANTTVTAASYGSATQVPTYTVNAQGQLTAASNTSIQIAESQVTNLVTDLAAKAPLAATARLELARTTNQNVSDATVTIVNFNSTVENIGSYSISSGTVTVPFTGRYAITGFINWAQNGTNRRLIYIYKNSDVIWSQTSESTSEAGGFRQTISAYSERFTAGDEITLRGRQDAGSTTAITDARLIIDYIGT